MGRTVHSSERFGGRRAIVIGGSMAGLLATRVLSDHFDEVVLVERDKLSDSAEARNGVPQGRQLHALLKPGVDILDELFPDLIAALLAGGGQALDVSADFRWHHFGMEKARFASGITAIATTRTFLEREVRRRVLAIKGVCCFDERDALGFIASKDRSRITGVRLGLRLRSGESAEAEEEVLGDLIVDAAGRGSPRVRQNPPLRRALRGDQGAEPLTGIAMYKFPANKRHHYERLGRFPEGLAILGDSLCSFNPIYGQGMTTAGLVALALDGCLREQRRSHGGAMLGLSRRFQAEAARITEVPWRMAATEDFRYPEVEGKRPLGQSIMEWYLDRVHQVVERDTTVARCFLQVMHMLVPPTALLAPSMMARVLAGGFPRARVASA